MEEINRKVARNAKLTQSGQNKENPLSREIIAAALEVHKGLGPGLLESVYEDCLAHEMSLRKMSFVRQQVLPVAYKDLEIEAAFRLDFLVEDLVIVEIKAVDELLPIHKAQLLTYLNMTDKRLGLLINFNVPLLRDGIKRVANDMPD
jgi:GxxExxY protein